MTDREAVFRIVQWVPDFSYEFSVIAVTLEHIP